jgi:hypothetical protein
MGTMTLKKSRLAILIFLPIMLIMTNTGCNRTQIGVVIGKGVETSLDQAAAKSIGTKVHQFEVPIIAIKLDLSFAPAYFDLGRVLNAMNRPQDAKKAFEDYERLQR